MDSSKTNVSDGGTTLSPKRRRVGLLYDDRMRKHFDASPHPENPNRIVSIWEKLQSSGIHQRCILLNAKEAKDKIIALVHTKKHIDRIKSISSPKFDSRRNRIAGSFNSIYFNEGSSEAAYLAAGSVVEVAEKVAKGELDSAFAIVRPPGHHAEANEPMGFCLYNNVAIAASYLLNERTELGINKILIVDWDVHHGNGTQKMFWKDSRVLCFSVHRHESGSFYPSGDDGSYEMIGEGPGAGYNINVPWENHSCGDADYLAVWDHVLIPVAKAFDPNIIIISAGFDAAINDPLGGCCVSPYGYSIMLSKLMEFAGGKIVMALEGGYDIASLANSALACVEVLLDQKAVAGYLDIDPFESTWRVIQLVREQLSSFWATLAMKLPEDVTHERGSPVLVASSDSDGEFNNGPHSKISEDLAAALEQVIAPLQNVTVEDGQVSFALPTDEFEGIPLGHLTSGASMAAEATSVSSAALTSTTASDEAGRAQRRAKRKQDKIREREKSLKRLGSSDHPSRSKKGKGLAPTEADLAEKSKWTDLSIRGRRGPKGSFSLRLSKDAENPLELEVKGEEGVTEMFEHLQKFTSADLGLGVLTGLGILQSRLEGHDEEVTQAQLKALSIAREYDNARRELMEVVTDRDSKASELKAVAADRDSKASKLKEVAADRDSKATELAQVVAENRKLMFELEFLKSQHVNQGVFGEVLFQKVLQTKGFASFASDLCKETVKVGQGSTLSRVGRVYPQLGLRRKKMGWHPDAVEEARRYYVRKVKGELPKFALLEHLKAQDTPLTLDQVRSLNVDYDTELDGPSEPLGDFEDVDKDPSEVN